MSRRLDKQSAETNALRTLDERRQAQAARNAPSARPVPGYGQQDDRRTPPPPLPQGYGYGYGQAPAPTQPPVIVRQDSGLGHVVAGAIIAGAAANSHANTHANNGNNNGSNNSGGGYYPAPGGGGGELAAKAGADAVGTATAGRDAAGRDAAGTEAAGQPAAHKASGGSIFGTVLWLLVLALIGWAVVFAWRRVRARREAGKPNYSFERN
jgi:hypothetical protein